MKTQFLVIAACGISLFTAGDAAAGPPIQFVSPGQSIQTAINNAAEGGWVFIRPGTYIETSDPVNGLSITRSLNLVGLSALNERVVLMGSGAQKNGIVVVPAAHTNCMSCHQTTAPPFDLLPGVNRALPQTPAIRGVSIRGITIKNFQNNGLFARNISDFSFIDVHTVDIPNYGIFPTLSSDGLIADSSASGSDDSGIWIETSQNVLATRNVVEGNLMGIEVSNSDSILLDNNEVRGNAVGMGILFLPYLLPEFPAMRHVTIRNNNVHDNNRPNTAPHGSLLSIVPSGIGIFHFGADDSLLTGNKVESHNLIGIAVVDFCLASAGTPLDCANGAVVPPDFLPVSGASNNRVVGNDLRDNGRNPAGSSFQFAAGDIALLTRGDNGNCFSENRLTTFYSALGLLPACH